MKKLLFPLFYLVYLITFGQEDNSRLNTLKAPSSPAASLLNFTPSTIQTFSDRTKIEGELNSFSQKSDKFTALPQDFAISISPFQIFSKEKPKHFFRNIAFSLAYRDSIKVDLLKMKPIKPQIALGFSFKFAFKKAKDAKKSEARTTIDAINALKYQDFFKTQIDNNVAILKQSETDIRALGLGSGVEGFSNYVLLQEFEKETRKAFKEKKNIFQFFDDALLDISGGRVYNTLDTKTDNDKLQQWGIWGSFSKTSLSEKTVGKEKVISEVGYIVMARMLKNVNTTFEKLKDNVSHSLDIGGKFIYNINENNRFFVEAELLGRRNYLDVDKDKNLKWKYDLNLGYQIRPNLVVTAAFGKDFGSRTVNKTGNLFALLNLVGGIGQSK